MLNSLEPPGVIPRKPSTAARIVSELKARHPGIPVICFPREAGEHYVGFHKATGADCVAIDNSVDPEWAAFFDELKDDAPDILKDLIGASWSPRETAVIGTETAAEVMKTNGATSPGSNGVDLGDERARSRHTRERRGVALVEEQLRVYVRDGEHGDHLEREEERGAHPRVRLAEPKVGVAVEAVAHERAPRRWLAEHPEELRDQRLEDDRRDQHDARVPPRDRVRSDVRPRHPDAQPLEGDEERGADHPAVERVPPQLLRQQPERLNMGQR